MPSVNPELAADVSIRLSSLMKLIDRTAYHDLVVMYEIAHTIGRCEFNGVSVPKELLTFFEQTPPITLYILLEFSRVRAQDEESFHAVIAAAVTHRQIHRLSPLGGSHGSAS